MLTLLIPTHNRSLYLTRCLDFLYRHNDVCRLVIADSSDSDFFEKNNALVNKYAGRFDVNIIDCRGMDIFGKYIYALAGIDSEFVTVCGDDDFVVPSVAAKCAHFLSKNHDYSLAQGKIVTFVESSLTHKPLGSLRFYPQHGNERELVERVKTHFQNYRNSFYSVHRTGWLLENFRRVGGLDIGRGLKERMLSALDSVQGKRKMFSELFLLRQKGITGVDERGNRTFNDNPADASYFSDISFGYDVYADFILDYARSKENLSQDELGLIKKYVSADFSMWRGIRETKPKNASSMISMVGYRKIRGAIESLTVRSEVGEPGRTELGLVEEAIRRSL